MFHVKERNRKLLQTLVPGSSVPTRKTAWRRPLSIITDNNTRKSKMPPNLLTLRELEEGTMLPVLRMKVTKYKRLNNNNKSKPLSTETKTGRRRP